VTTTRVTQQVVESLVDAGAGAIHVTQLVLEALDAGADPILATQVVLEALTEDGAPVFLTQAVLEVLISDSLQAEEVSQICLLWRIRRRDGTEQRFASLDADVTWGGQTWTAAAPFDATAAEASRSLAAGQMEVAGLLAAPEITADGLLNGLYDDAEVTVLRVDWGEPSRGAEVVLAGRIGRVTAGQTRFEAELLLPSALLDRPVLDLYTPECRVDLFSAPCGVAAAAWTRTATITSIISDTAVVAADFTEPAGWADHGRVTITGGGNAGARREIRSHGADGLIELDTSRNRSL
jgi:uncharacterized phage protein (TIGR02218 family)